MFTRYIPLLLAFFLLQTCRESTDTEEMQVVDFESLPEEEKHLAQNAIYSFDTPGDLAVSQFAAEPTLINPTNIDIDSRGRVWVCEVQNYRLPFNREVKARSKGDRILILEDTDGDGVSDKKQVFYEGNDINAALGIAVLGDRVIVSASPHILIFYDDDNNDVADRKDTLFTAIKGVDDDHGVHAFIFGPDGRLYFNYGNAGYQIRDKEGQPIIDKFGRTIEANRQPYQQGMVFRCHEDGSNLEVLGHNFRNIYELCVDSYGSIFQSDNDDDGNKSVRINYVMEYGNYGYRDEVTGAGWRQSRVGMHPNIPMQHWHQNDPGVIPNMLNTGSGSPAGITFNEGSLLPDRFVNQPIHAEPGHQEVRAYITSKEGAGYKASVENLLKSEDLWFRPSDVCIAPDGSLFVSDWHDAVVGGNGMDDIARGRIYRVAPPDKIKSYNIPTFDLTSNDGAAQALKSPNMATRYLAWQKLHSSGLDAEPSLLKLIEEEDPVHSIRAFWLLAHLPQKGSPYIQRLSANGSENVRIAAIRMMRHLYPEELLPLLTNMAEDPSPQVRREIAVALTGHCTKEAVDIWLQLTRHPHDRWMLEALGMVTDHCPNIYFDALDQYDPDIWSTEKGRNFMWRIRSPKAMPLLESIIKDSTIAKSNIPRFIRSFHFIDDPHKNVHLTNILDFYRGDSTMLCYYISSIDPNFLIRNRRGKNLVLTSLDKIKGAPEWFDAIRMLRLGNKVTQLWEMTLQEKDHAKQRQAMTTIVQLGGTRFLQRQIQKLSPENYQMQVAMLGSHANEQIASFLVGQLHRRDLSFHLKRDLVDALGNSHAGQQRLYAEIKAGKLEEDLTLPAAVKLLNCWDSEIRNEAPKIIASVEGATQAPDLFSLSRKTGYIENGQKVFTQNCASCHQVNGAGIRFGPDLSEIGSKLSVRGLYQAILYPSASINFGFEGLNVKMKDGQRYQGYAESKTGQSLLLRTQSGQSVELLHSEIDQQEPMKNSLMTQGLNALMTQDELVDLVTFLSTLKKVENGDIE